VYLSIPAAPQQPGCWDGPGDPRVTHILRGLSTRFRWNNWGSMSVAMGTKEDCPIWSATIYRSFSMAILDMGRFGIRVSAKRY
jgi:hypothetical protein